MTTANDDLRSSSTRPVDDGQLLAAAICHLSQADPSTLDPEGVAAQTWPWDEPFTPSLRRLTNIRVGIAFAQAEQARLELLGEDYIRRG